MPTQSAGHPSDLVLVAVMPNQRDLEIARVLGWYRSAQKRPKVISVDYLAFIRPCLLAGGTLADRWVAPILGHELTTRAELLHDQPDHPRAEEEYFKLQLGPLEELAQPIPAGSWKRITFFYTTMGRIWQAESLADLPVHDEERTVLWQSLRERALKANEYQAIELPMLPLDPAILALLSGKWG